MKRNGTMTAHGREWPLYDRSVFSVSVVGFIDATSLESAEDLRKQLEAILGRYGVTVKVEAHDLVDLSPEDKAEKFRFDDLAFQGLSHMVPKART